MTRITISLAPELANALAREATRRRTSVSAVAREAIEIRLGRVEGAHRTLPFVALGRSGHRTTARDVDAILSTEWGDDRSR
jgi:predicted transcriptional regulator